MDRANFPGYSHQSNQMMTDAVSSANLPTTSRYTTKHGTSSAFGENATPNEDWTTISDLAERRRIQNRIAQRNYRKKLKSRLEDLERRRAGSTSASPEPAQAETAQQPKPQTRKSQSPTVNSTITRRRKNSATLSNQTDWSQSHGLLSLQGHETYGTAPEARGVSIGGIYTEQLNSREIAISSPPDTLFYQSYPSSSEAYSHHRYYPSPHQHNVFQNMPHSQYGEIPGQIASQHPLHQLSQPKQANLHSVNQELNPLYLNYDSTADLDMPASHQSQYDQQMQISTRAPLQPPPPSHSTNTFH